MQVVSGEIGIQTKVWLLNMYFSYVFLPLNIGIVSPVLNLFPVHPSFYSLKHLTIPGNSRTKISNDSQMYFKNGPIVYSLIFHYCFIRNKLVYSLFNKQTM